MPFSIILFKNLPSEEVVKLNVDGAKGQQTASHDKNEGRPENVRIWRKSEFFCNHRIATTLFGC